MMRVRLKNGDPKVSVIIINYNGLLYLHDLLQSLREQTCLSFETFLIDNASHDGSVSYVRNQFSWVKVFPQPTNVGFSRAGNLGAEQSEAEYLVFLNADIKLDPQWIEVMIGTVERDPSIAAVASKMRLYHQPDTLNGVGGAMNYLGYTWDRGMFEKDSGQYDQCQEVLFASAGAALFRRSHFVEVGGFDEKFFMYHEDVDLCWRLWMLGFRVVPAPRAVTFHHFGGSTVKARGMRWRELIGERNSIRSLLKNYELSNLRRALTGLLLLRQPPGRKYQQCKNFLWNLIQLPNTLRERSKIQKRRCRSDLQMQYLIVQSKDVPIRL